MKSALRLVAVGFVSAFAQVASAMVPFPLDWAALSHSVIDLRCWLDAPAGQHGFVRERDGHLATGDGKRFRIWGVNLCGPECFPAPAQAVAQADALARLGFNCVRLHHMDAPWSGLFDPSHQDTLQLDAGALERLDFFVAQLKQRGIYVNLNLNVGRTYKAGDGVRDFARLGFGKSATYFNPRLIALQHEYARQLLTHSNRYTRTEYRNEPAVASVEIVNENSLLEGWLSWRLVGKDEEKPQTWSPVPVSYAQELTGLYNAWLAQNRPAACVAKLRKEAGVGGNAPVPRLAPYQFAQASAERFQTEAEFLMSLEQSFFAGMKHLLKDELGVQSALVGCADHGHTYAAYAHIAALATCDWIDGHGYWQHPDLSTVTKCQNTPMVNEPLDSLYTQIARTPVKGRAFTISEVNHPFPHEFACEGYAILTAYALFSDWDGIYWFAWDRGPGEPQSFIRNYGWFDLSIDPMKLANLIACGVMWHRGDLAAAKETIVRSYSHAQMIEALRMDRDKEHPFFTPGYARSTPLQHATVFAMDGSPATPFPAAAPLGAIVADTGELGWYGADKKTGVVAVDSARTQALIGYVRDGGRSVSHLSAAVTNEFCTLVLTSLDNEPVSASRRLLLSTTAWCGNLAMKWAGTHHNVLLDWGHGPVQIEPVTGNVTLTGLGKTKSIHVRPLSPLGAPTQSEWPVASNDGGCTISIGTPAATLALVELER